MQTGTGEPLFVAMPIGTTHGWGVCGRYLTGALSRLCNVRLITEVINEDLVQDELEAQALLELSANEQELVSLLDRKCEAPLLQCIFGKHLKAYQPDIRGRINVAYTFFEENVFSGETLKNLRENFDWIVSGSSWCTENLKAYGFKNISTILQGIDTNVFRPRSDEKDHFGDRFVVFSGGKIELRKGQDIVIRAFKVLQDRHPDVMLVHAWFNHWDRGLTSIELSRHIQFNPTSDTWMGRINELLVQNGIDLNRTILVRPRPNTSFARIYHNTDVGLFPNRCEGGTNLVLMEYMASGRPAIATYNSGHRDVLTKENALLLERLRPITMTDSGMEVAHWEEPDIEETVEMLEWAYQNREKLAPIGARAAADMAKLTWSKSATQFHHLIRRLCA